MRGWFLVLLLLVSVVPPGAWAGVSPVSRQQVQAVLNAPGNVRQSPTWSQGYQARAVRWQGQVYKVDSRTMPGQVDVLVKILPNTPLYDTILVVPSTHPWAHTLRPGQRVAFAGQISQAIDNRIFRAVQVDLTSAEGAWD